MKEHNRAICAIAKTSYWTIRGLYVLATAVMALVVLFWVIAGPIMIYKKVKADWDWNVFFGFTALFVSIAVIILVIWAGNKCYEWAERYKNDC